MHRTPVSQNLMIPEQANTWDSCYWAMEDMVRDI